MSSQFSPIALDNLINEVAGSINDIDEFCKSTFDAVKADIEKGIII